MANPVISRFAKLKAMSAAEVATRVSYAGRLAWERRRIQAARPPAALRPGDVERWMAAIAQRGADRPRFFASIENAERTRALFAPDGPYAANAEESRRAAADAKQHRFTFFGRTFTYGDAIDWHADPVSGRQWPRVFHRDVPIHSGGAAIGDVKYVWELNRHQFLIDLGKAYWLFGDRDAAAAIYRIVSHWIDANPYGVGVNWSCALEPAFRAWSWLWAYAFCAGDERLDDRMRAKWLRSFYEHGYFLHRHLEHYASPYNHLIGEACALYALGVLFPEMPEAGRWRRRGRHVLISQIRSQFHADGGTVEQSTFYHHATLGFYLLASILGEANGESLPTLDAPIQSAIDFSMSLMQPDGRLPRIGGADDGKPIVIERRPFWDFRAYQAIGAVRYGRADFRFAAGDFAEDALWLLGPEARARFFALDAAPPPLAKALPDSGYFVLRSGWSADADYLCFDCGEQAGGLRKDDVPSAAHGHADCLSLVLWLRGRPVLVDPGFYCYNGEPAWEVYFRRTAAHNAATVDGLDQSQHVHKMAWTHVFTPRLEAFRPAARGGAVCGSHDGFLRRAGVVHRRAVWLHDSGCAAICDEFSGSGAHDLAIHFQLAPGAATLTDDASAVVFDDAELAWTANAPARARLTHGGDGPDGGWVVPSLGVREPAPHLVVELPFRAPVTTCLTLVAPRVGDSRRLFAASTDPDTLALDVIHAPDARTRFVLATASSSTADSLLDRLTVAAAPPSARASSTLAPMASV